MTQLTVMNNTKRVIVLKAMSMPNLRLFPGPNYVEEEGFGKYFKNKAAKAMQNTDLQLTDKVLSAEEKEAAAKAKKKNDELNKAQRVIKTQNETLVQNDQTISDQAKEIEKLQKQIAKLEKKLDDSDDDGKNKKGK